MRPVIVLFLLIFLTSFDNLQQQKNGQYSEEYQKLTTKLTSVRTLKAKFSQSKKIAVLKRPLISSGELIFDRQAGVSWTLLKPYQSTIIIDNDKLTSIDDAGKKIVIKAADQPMLYGFTKIFMAIFSGNTDELKNHFEIYYKMENDQWQIGLIPTSSELKKVLNKILMTGKDNKVNAITLWETNSDITEISFTDIVEADQLSVEDKKQFEVN